MRRADATRAGITCSVFAAPQRAGCTSQPAQFAAAARGVPPDIRPGKWGPPRSPPPAMSARVACVGVLGTAIGLRESLASKCSATRSDCASRSRPGARPRDRTARVARVQVLGHAIGLRELLASRCSDTRSDCASCLRRGARTRDRTARVACVEVLGHAIGLCESLASGCSAPRSDCGYRLVANRRAGSNRCNTPDEQSVHCSCSCLQRHGCSTRTSSAARALERVSTTGAGGVETARAAAARGAPFFGPDVWRCTARSFGELLRAERQ